MAEASVERYLVEGEDVLYEMETDRGRAVFTDRRAIILEAGFRDVSYDKVISVETSQRANLFLLQYGSMSLIVVLWLFLMEQVVRLEYPFLTIVEEVLMIFGVVLLGSYFQGALRVPPDAPGRDPPGPKGRGRHGDPFRRGQGGQASGLAFYW
ncbi:MAG: hypothetical protein GXO65_04250 [Euryarchaeota archaeon]|nr:hypothetical protein [Euryarchaeota archaeon]